MIFNIHEACHLKNKENKVVFGCQKLYKFDFWDFWHPPHLMGGWWGQEGGDPPRVNPIWDCLDFLLYNSRKRKSGVSPKWGQHPTLGLFGIKHVLKLKIIIWNYHLLSTSIECWWESHLFKRKLFKQYKM